MTRFLQAFATTVLPLMVLAAVLVAVVGLRAGEPLTADTTTLQQTEDSESDGADDAAAAPGSPALVGVARLLEVLAVSGEPTGVTAGDQRVFLTRDPFDPVVVEPSSGGLGDDGSLGGSDGGDTDGGGTDGGGTDGGGTDGGGTDGGGTDGGGTQDVCSGDENEQVCEGRVVTVNTVTDQQAEIVVDGTIFTVGVNEDFATSFRVLALDPPCVTMLYGDEAFTLCTGVTVLK